MRNVAALSGLLIAIHLAGCSSGATPIHEINERYKDVLSGRDNHYRIKPGDSVTIKFYNQDADLTQTLLVLPDGRTDPFFMDDAVFAGKTVPELEEEIRKYYAQQIQNPEISLGVAPSGETVILEGMVEKPSVQPYTVKMTLMQAMGNAGGYKLTARLPGIIVRRPFLDPKHPDVFRIDLSAYSDTPEELFLLPNDHIIVKRNWWILGRDYLTEYAWGMFPPFFYWIPGMVAGL